MGDDQQKSFLEACGLGGPLRVRLEGPEPLGGLLLEFRRPFVVVGRDDRVELPIDSPEVSRRHAYFQVVDGRVFCVDLGSRTGVRWADGARDVGWVDRDQGVEVGPVRIHFDGQGDEPGSAGQGGQLPISRSFEGSPLPDARLEFLGAESDRAPWQVSRALVLIGRSPTCRVRLLGPEIARIHAALVRTPRGIWAVDLLGREARLRVGGAVRRSARLEDGDEIELGQHRIRIRIGRAAQPSGRSELARRPMGQAGPPAPVRVGRSASPGTEVGAATRGPDDPRGSLDPVTERLFDQFDRMHQQTTEQFRQAILMMFRMHQDQMELIRQELSRLDQLEDEQKSLQAELARGSNPPRPSRTVLRLVSGESGPSPHPVKATIPVWAHPDPARASEKRPALVPTPAEVAPPPANLRADGGPPPSDPDPHARLSQRLAEIQDERQGLWKRLLGTLTGGESERILP
jgi:pSer/pThr/pTyr-binding forkhead associated (FHA) protein